MNHIQIHKNVGSLKLTKLNDDEEVNQSNKQIYEMKLTVSSGYMADNCLCEIVHNHVLSER